MWCNTLYLTLQSANHTFIKMISTPTVPYNTLLVWYAHFIYTVQECHSNLKLRHSSFIIILCGNKSTAAIKQCQLIHKFTKIKEIAIIIKCS